MECRFPVGEVNGITIAVLLVQTADQHVGLFLRPAPREALDPTRNLYYTTWSFTHSDGSYWFVKLALLGSDLYDLRFRGKPIHTSWKTIYICTGCDGPSDRIDVAWTIYKSPSAYTSPTPFRLSRTAINGMAALGLTLRSDQLPCLTSSESQPQVWYDFFDRFTVEKVIILVGSCVASNSRCIWAYVKVWHEKTLGSWKPHSGHDCATDHIADWPNRTRVFGDGPPRRRITLWFTDCPHTPGAVVFYLRPGGRVYDKMLRSANVTFPLPPVAASPVTSPVPIQRRNTVPMPPRPDPIPLRHPSIAAAGLYASTNESPSVSWFTAYQITAVTDAP